MSNRDRLSRRTVLQATGSLGALSAATSVAAGSCVEEQLDERERNRRSSRRDASDDDDAPSGTEQHAATVDRIVDGEHVVLLLEADGDVVDQLVVSADEFDDIAEGDSLVVLVEDGELRSYRVVR